MHHFRFHIGIFVGFLIGSWAVSAQSMLPNSFSGWTANGETQFTLASSSFDAEAQAALSEYGFASGQEADFTRAGALIHVRLYNMKDPTGAYGLYSYLRTQDMPHADLTAHSAISRDRALALSGNLVLDIRGSQLPKVAADLKVLVGAVASHAQEGPLPMLPQHLPINDMVERSDHYILGPQTLNQFISVTGANGDWLGFSEGAEAEVATYRLGGKEVTLVVADFPTPQSAMKKLAELKSKYNVIGVLDSAPSPGGMPASGAPPLFAKRSVTLLAILAGPANQADAAALLKQVHSGTELTWNEPNFELTQPNIGTIIVGTIIGTGIICAFAIISGLAFGGVRLVVKRLLPDKVFDRSSHLQVLQLGLSSKPIKAEDFYSLGGSTPE